MKAEYSIVNQGSSSICHFIRTAEKTIADILPIENVSDNPGPREIVRVSKQLQNME